MPRHVGGLGVSRKWVCMTPGCPGRANPPVTGYDRAPWCQHCHRNMRPEGTKPVKRPTDNEEYLARYRAVLGSMGEEIHPVVHIQGGPCTDDAPERDEFVPDARGVTCEVCKVAMAVVKMGDDPTEDEFNPPHPMAKKPLGDFMRDAAGNPLAAPKPTNIYAERIGRWRAEQDKIERTRRMERILNRKLKKGPTR